MNEWMPKPVAMDLVGKVRGFTEWSHPMSLILCLYVNNLIHCPDGFCLCGCWIRVDENTRVESPTDACINVFLLTFEDLEDVVSAVGCLHVLISFLTHHSFSITLPFVLHNSSATVYITLKYQAAWLLICSLLFIICQSNCKKHIYNTSCVLVTHCSSRY